MTLFATGEGNTPLSPEEQADLIPNLATREELNEWERFRQHSCWPRLGAQSSNASAERPYRRAVSSSPALPHVRPDVEVGGALSDDGKNIGIPHYQIRESLAALLGDAGYWLEHGTYSPDEIAIRFHHRLVFLHPFANGNGRHGRLMADDAGAGGKVCRCSVGEERILWSTESFGAGTSMHCAQLTRAILGLC